MKKWQIPEDTFHYIFKRNLFPLLKKIIADFNQPPAFIGVLIGHHLKSVEGRVKPSSPFDYNRIYQLVDFIIRKKLKRDILKAMLPVVFQYPNMDFESVLTTIGFQAASEEEILEHIPALKEKFAEISKAKDEAALVSWVMGRLRPLALGNLRLNELYEKVAAYNGGNDE
jgi:glutamyl-tRNA(Gln) amidotransferase subunit E